MNNLLFLNVSEWSFFFFWCLFIFIAVHFCYFLFCFSVNCFFQQKKNSFFDLRYVPLVIKAKHIAVGLFPSSLVEDGTMFVLSYFCT